MATYKLTSKRINATDILTSLPFKKVTHIQKNKSTKKYQFVLLPLVSLLPFRIQLKK